MATKMTDFFKKVVPKDESRNSKDEKSAPKMTDFFKKVVPKDAPRMPRDETARDDDGSDTDEWTDDIKEVIPDNKRESDISSTVSETSSDTSIEEIVEVVQTNKRKRVEEEVSAGSSSKRRSEGPDLSVKIDKNISVKVDKNSVRKQLGFASKESDKGEKSKGEKVKERKESIDEVQIIGEKEPSVQGNKDSDDKNDSQEEYEVEKIVDYQYCRESDQGLYFVKWVGWDSADNTWEPQAHIECDEVLVAFYKARLQERENATPADKRKLELPPDPRETHQIRQEFIRENCPRPTKEELNEKFIKDQKLKNKGVKKSYVPIVSEPILNSFIDKLAKSSAPNKQLLDRVKEQILLRDVRDARERQVRDIRLWENEINNVDKNSAKIVVENEFDLEGAPRKMKYINQYVASEGIEIPDDPPIGCECTSCEVKTERNCCPGMNGHNMAYTKHAKLRIGLGTPIWECNKKCACTTDCYNRVVQGGRKHKLCIYRTDNGCGWGVKALENIKAGSFVVDYVGEVIGEVEAEKRGETYDAQGCTYLFDLDFNRGTDKTTKDETMNKYTVDAAFMGNLSHFVNHSCDPNMHIFNVYINCLDPDLPQICFFARREIKKGEPLTFDYHQSFGNKTENEEDSDDEDDSARDIFASPNSKKTPSKAVKKTHGKCRCGAVRCRGLLF